MESESGASPSSGGGEGWNLDPEAYKQWVLLWFAGLMTVVIYLTDELFIKPTIDTLTNSKK